MSQPFIDDYDRQQVDRTMARLERRLRTHLDEDGQDELWHLLWEAHNGDNTCGCLQAVIWAEQVRDQMATLWIMRHCIANHAAGEEYRAFLGAEE